MIRRQEYRFYKSINGSIFAAETEVQQGHDSDGDWHEYHAIRALDVAGQVASAYIDVSDLEMCREITREHAIALCPDLFKPVPYFPEL